jgi:chromosome segregation ATPase
MESDASKADRVIKESVSESAAKRGPTTQAISAVIADLNKAANQSGASLTGKIEAKSLLAQAEFEAGDRTLRDLNRLNPAISRALWDIGQAAAQVQKVNDSAKALASNNPDATLKVIADKRAEMVTAGEGAGKKAGELQSEIDKIKAQVATLTQQKDAAMTEADAAADKASKASDKEASALLDAATEGRRKAGNVGHEIDKLSAALLPLERDLAVEQWKKTTADQAVAGLDESKKSADAGWQAVQGQVQERKALAAKLGEELAAKGKVLDDLTKQAAELRAKAVKHFEDSAGHNASASNDARSLATQLGQWSNDEKFSKSPEKKAWEQLRAIYHLNNFKLYEAEAGNTLGTLYTSQAQQQDERAKLVAAISKTLQEAGIAMPASLAAPADGKALDAAMKAYADAAAKFQGVYEGGGAPKDVQQAARIARMFSLYGQYINGDKGKLGEAKTVYTAYKEQLADPKDDQLARWLPADLRG